MRNVTGWLARLVAGLGLACAAACGLAVMAGRALPHQVLAFTSRQQGTDDIFLMDVAHHLTRPLAPSSNEDCCAVWSPDGRHLAFRSWRDTNWEIFLINADGSNVRRLTANDALDSAVSWSPDSRSIAFVSVSAQDTNFDIYTVQAACDNSLCDNAPRRLTNADAPEGDPVWSPDGRWIAYVTQEGFSGDSEIGLIDTQTGAARLLTDNNRDDWSPAWSPDSRSLVFLSQQNGTTGLHRVAADCRLPDCAAQPLLAEGSLVDGPAWSPDGRSIAFYTYCNGTWNLDIIDAARGRLSAPSCEGRTELFLVENVADTNPPAWSPDGRSIAFLTGDGRIGVVDVGSRAAQLLSAVSSLDRWPAWKP
jgi:TolB protein